MNNYDQMTEVEKYYPQIYIADGDDSGYGELTKSDIDELMQGGYELERDIEDYIYNEKSKIEVYLKDSGYFLHIPLICIPEFIEYKEFL